MKTQTETPLSERLQGSIKYSEENKFERKSSALGPVALLAVLYL